MYITLLLSQDESNTIHIVKPCNQIIIQSTSQFTVTDFNSLLSIISSSILQLTKSGHTVGRK